MVGFFQNLFDIQSFPPRWSCGQWTVGHGYLHIMSDFAIWGAYTAIPIVLAYFVLRRRDVPFPKLFWLFCLFIYSCGATHLLEGLIFWWPAYRFLGVIKLLTAVASWITVFALIRAMPIAIRFPQLAEVNADLARANNNLSEFASIVSHDLRAPLRGITALTTWMEEDDQGLSPTARQHLHALRQQTRKMEALLEGILRYSRIGIADIEYEQVDSHRCAQEAVAAINPPAGITVHIEGRLPVIVFHEMQLYQVFQNLIQNAVKHMGKPEGTIKISFRESRDFWIFQVADTGQGIDPRHHERIFKIFQSLHSGEEEVSGLGLALVKKIVEQQGGHVTLESTPGEGSKFCFAIPKALEERRRMRGELSARAGIHGGQAVTPVTGGE